jgi:hypothetical protein
MSRLSGLRRQQIYRIVRSREEEDDPVGRPHRNSTGVLIKHDAVLRAPPLGSGVWGIWGGGVMRSPSRSRRLQVAKAALSGAQPTCRCVPTRQRPSAGLPRGGWSARECNILAAPARTVAQGPCELEARRLLATSRAKEIDRSGPASRRQQSRRSIQTAASPSGRLDRWGRQRSEPSSGQVTSAVSA